MAAKSAALAQFLGGLAGERRAYACLQLAATLVSQAEAQARRARMQAGAAGDAESLQGPNGAALRRRLPGGARPVAGRRALRGGVRACALLRMRPRPAEARPTCARQVALRHEFAFPLAMVAAAVAAAHADFAPLLLARLFHVRGPTRGAAPACVAGGPGWCAGAARRAPQASSMRGGAGRLRDRRRGPVPPALPGASARARLRMSG